MIAQGRTSPSLQSKASRPWILNDSAQPDSQLRVSGKWQARVFGPGASLLGGNQQHGDSEIHMGSEQASLQRFSGRTKHTPSLLYQA